MWFCDVDTKFGVGENIPWFMTDAEEVSIVTGGQIAPGLERVTIRTLEQLESTKLVNCVLELEPEAELFRNNHFLDAVVEVALRGCLPVVIRGSALGHAFYTLHRRGVLVVATESARTRARQRQVFRKLVRDEIPSRIIEKGERVNVARIAKSESRMALVVKLHEEAQELLRASNPGDVTAELADLLEIVRALCSATGIDFTEVQRAAEIKRDARRSFEKNVVLLDTSWPAWKEKPQDHRSSTIKLSDLANVEREGAVQIANFVSILSGGGATIEVADGLRINIRLTGKGLEVRQADEVESISSQLSFAFR
jgi:predicted house-cleaning noncanonical NTP pyrophosphatase (MazG superfamily)